jgi:uncharacterized protein
MSTVKRRARLESGLFVSRSAINGLGVFSRKFIPAGTPVLECRGLIQHRDEVDADARAMQIGPDTYLAEDPENPTVDDFLNHGCQPNLGFVDGSLVLYALRDIDSAEELVFDYSTTMDEPGWVIRCRCRAPNCRGKVRSYSELPKREQKRLRRIALTYLRR